MTTGCVQKVRSGHFPCGSVDWDGVRPMAREEVREKWKTF